MILDEGLALFARSEDVRILVVRTHAQWRVRVKLSHHNGKYGATTKRLRDERNLRAGSRRGTGRPSQRTSTRTDRGKERVAVGSLNLAARTKEKTGKRELEGESLVGLSNRGYLLRAAASR